MKWQTESEQIDLLTALIQYESISGTKGEMAIVEYVYELLRERPYFKQNPKELGLHRMKDGRHYVTALVKRSDLPQTVLLLSHVDVVDTEDYGECQQMACKPEELMTAFLRKRDLLPTRVKEDLASGDWLFGRGAMDMKAGLTVQLSMLERAMNGRFEGNVLLITVPDEEVNSQGMLEAVPKLKEIMEENGLEYTACLNSEPMFEKYPGDMNYYIYTGSIGKVLAGFFCKGIETHVGEPFSGINANFMVSVLNRLLEMNHDFCEEVDGEMTPPPTNLMQKDLKEAYSVQTPHMAVSLFNVLVMQRSSEQLHGLLYETAKQAAVQMEDDLRQKTTAFQRFTHFTPIDTHITVLTYRELYQKAMERSGAQEVEQMIQATYANRGGLGDRDVSTKIVSELTTLCKEDGPLIVLFYSPPFYPSVSSTDDPHIQKTLQKIQKEAKEVYGLEIEEVRYFPGLSDLSYLQLEKQQIDDYTTNMPLYKKGYALPHGEKELLYVPVINVGPLGKDPHKWTERVHMPFTFGILPELLESTIHSLLEKSEKAKGS
ncbi:M20/M25/M40 family metallo-hydrolase [Bacillus sp. 179-C3.3 HS]|uniref:M20/M25/M40 family metallo-hydrolase n=1 Tax=Bacillus sp. 179-C3.3 HS TaxID=3232162 RepID=UPI0039A12395